MPLYQHTHGFQEHPFSLCKLWIQARKCLPQPHCEDLEWRRYERWPLTLFSHYLDLELYNILRGFSYGPFLFFLLGVKA